MAKRVNWSVVDWSKPTAQIASEMGCDVSTAYAARSRLGKKNQVGWLVIDPSGQCHKVVNLKEWCGDIGLYSRLISLANGQCATNKDGWEIYRMVNTQ